MSIFPVGHFRFSLVIMTKAKVFSKIANNYPSYRDINGVKLNAYKYSTSYFLIYCEKWLLTKLWFDFRWLQSRQKDDNAEGFWRVHDTLYDLTDFIDRHPGGVDWIKLTKVRCKLPRFDHSNCLILRLFV